MPRFIIILILSILFRSFATSQPDDLEKSLFKAIRDGDTASVGALIASGVDINGYYGKKADRTLLDFAVDAEEYEMVRFLVRQGADIEKPSGGITPLMEAAINNDLLISRYLLDQGASVDPVDKNGNTALFYAAKYGTLRLNRLLVQRGSDVSHKNCRKWMPHDMAFSSNKDTIVTYLRTMVVKRDSACRIPDFADGPHIIWDNHTRIFIVYLERDSAINQTLMVDHMMDMPDTALTFQGFMFDTGSYTLYRNPVHYPSEFDQVEKIFVVGDMHGQYDSLVRVLQVSNVIDQDLNWSWGTGHLVFTGDIFDRGDQVTECLWLIYKLERQALSAGGFVHFILGNHELMNLTNDLSYQSAKNNFFSHYFDFSYLQFFTPSTVLGQWLRSKKTMLRINDILFTHGGISSQMLAMHLELDSVNHMVRRYLNLEYDKRNSEALDLLLFSYGPFWYRGYFKNGHLPPEATQEQIDRILAYYGVSHMVIGHTDVPFIAPMFDGKVFPIDIPFHHPDYHQQSLLIEGERFYRVYLDGKKVLLK
ncbi:MAG TPA: ankyrin repeat domain-containing protein [Bacteroidales bacterium]|nr:ankyrin repeat domain-containing protein [Bacteroidales bacterium]HNS45662.1 ankyrin repeat domain-containing protein [Bacteroidales bacterium]